MKTTEFPRLPNGQHARAMDAEKPIFLDGQKVIFDKKIGLMPVELEQKTTAHLSKNNDGKPAF
jgi:hypothetical protein